MASKVNDDSGKTNDDIEVQEWVESVLDWADVAVDQVQAVDVAVRESLVAIGRFREYVKKVKRPAALESLDRFVQGLTQLGQDAHLGLEQIKKRVDEQICIAPQDVQSLAEEYAEAMRGR